MSITHQLVDPYCFSLQTGPSSTVYNTLCMIENRNSTITSTPLCVSLFIVRWCCVFVCTTQYPSTMILSMQDNIRPPSSSLLTESAYPTPVRMPPNLSLHYCHWHLSHAIGNGYSVRASIPMESSCFSFLICDEVYAANTPCMLKNCPVSKFGWDTCMSFLLGRC